MKRLQLALILLLTLTATLGAGTVRAAVTYFHHDALGSVVAATDEAGAVLWREHYEPYGERLDRAVSTDEHSIYYTGKPHDDRTGLTYFGARYYDPQIGRFMGIDPVGVDPSNIHSFNRYAYANNNPYKYVDPDGKAAVLAWFVTPPGIAALKYTGTAILGFLGGSAIFKEVVEPMLNEGTDSNSSNDGEGKKAEDSGKNSRHGDDGRAAKKAKDQIADLENQLVGAAKKEQKKMKQKIKNIKRDAARKKRGEEHSRAKKR